MSLIALEPTLHTRLERVAHELGQSAEGIVSEAVAARLEELESQQLAAEAAAFERLHPQLKEKYLHQFVVVYQGQVVDADPDLEALYDRVEEQLGETVVLIRQVRSVPEEVFYFHSTRLGTGR